MPASPSSCRNSASLPALPLAMTSFMACAERRDRAASARQSLALGVEQLRAAGFGQRQQGVEFVAAAGVALGRALQFDEAAAVVHYHAPVGIAIAVLGVIEYKHRHPPEEPHPHHPTP